MGRMLGFEPPRTTRAQILPVVGDWATVGAVGVS